MEALTKLRTILGSETSHGRNLRIEGSKHPLSLQRKITSTKRILMRSGVTLRMSSLRRTSYPYAVNQYKLSSQATTMTSKWQRSLKIQLSSRLDFRRWLWKTSTIWRCKPSSRIRLRWQLHRVQPQFLEFIAHPILLHPNLVTESCWGSKSMPLGPKITVKQTQRACRALNKL